MSLNALVYDAATRMLALREHSQKELRTKLMQKSFLEEDVDFCLKSLKKEGLQSDQRYTESLIRSAISRGKGLLYIKKTIQERGGCSQAVLSWQQQSDFDWIGHAVSVLSKKFSGKSLDYKQQQKAARFLQSRGFDTATIREALSVELG